jgi:Mce-associated membrane protein
MTTMAAPAGLRGWLREPLTMTAAALCVAAAVFAGWAGWSWYSAAQSGPSSYAQARDVALQAGEQAAQNLNTLDYRTASKGLALWEQSSTGTLHEEIVAGRAQFLQQVEQARTVTTARVLDAALTSLDTRTGTATIIVAVQLTVTPPKGTAVTKQNRLTGQLTRTASGWKLSSLGQVPVGAASGPAAPAP